jgi:glycosyltransferase involved in cell wall biosynthesis
LDSEYDGKDEKMAERTQVKQKKALILLPYLKNGDGTAVALMNYYQELIEHGWRIDFLVLKIFECEWLNKVKADGNNIYELPKENKYSYKVSRKIRSIIKEGKYDIVHVNMPGHVGFETLKMARQYGIGKRIFHAHNPRNNLNLKTVISTKVYDYLLQREATELVACSKSAGNSRFGNKDFQVLKNVIDTDRFVYRLEDRRYIREKLHIEKKVVVGVVGRFAAQKNPEFLLECFAEYNKLNKESVLLWIGDGELQEKIQDRAKNMGLKGACLFVGRKNNIEKWYSAMDLFLLPSKFEGMGIVFLEAQCTGLPCFGSTNVPIETEVTELMHRISLKQEANYWATAMKKVTDMSGDRRSRASEFINAGYTHEATKSDLLNMYEKRIK